MKRLALSDDEVIAGVCGGLGEYFEIDPVVIRVIWGLFFFVGGSGLLLYVIFWLAMPNKESV